MHTHTNVYKHASKILKEIGFNLMAVIGHVEATWKFMLNGLSNFQTFYKILYHVPKERLILSGKNKPLFVLAEFRKGS